VSTTSIHTSPKSFPEAQYGFVDRVLWQLVPYQPQNFLELIDVLRLGLKWLVAFKHSSPDMVVQRVEVRRVRRPLTFTIEFTAVGIAIQSWASFGDCRVCMRAVLLKYEARWQKWQNRSWILNKFRQQGYNIQFSIHFGRVWNKMQSSLPTETDARRNHNVLGQLYSLSYQQRLCESWWWKLRTYAKMNYLSDFGICDNSQCFLIMIITSCCWLFRAKLKIWHRIFI